jgi:hypothetical protein
MTKLLRCPFCGGIATMEQTEDNRWSVGCSDALGAECMGYQSLTTFARRGEAEAAWNRRAPGEPQTLIVADWNNLRQGSTALEPTLVITNGYPIPRS